MKHTLRRIGLMLLCFVLMLALSSTYAASEIIFTSVNDQLLDLSSSTMPLRKNGTIYVPYKVFTNEPSGNSPFGLNGVHNATTQTLVIYNWDHTLTFQIAHGYVYDEKMNTYSQPAYYINNTVYVPVSLISNKFGLSYSVIPSTASIVRITNSKANLSDDTFAYVAEVDSGLEQKIKEYKDSLKPDSGNSNNNNTDNPSNGNNSGNGEKPEKVETHPSAVYLTFEGNISPNTTEILDTLSIYNRKATFFVGTEDLYSQGDIVRRIVGEGHAIGLSASMGKTTASGDLTDVLNKANNALFDICGVTTRLVRIEGGSKDKLDSSYTDTLVNNGYRLWDYTLDSGDTKSGMSARRSANAVIKVFDGTSKPSVVRFGQTDITAAALKRVLLHMQENAIYSVAILESDTPVNFYKELR